MSKTIYDGSVKTQSIDSVKSLLAYVGRASDPMPIFVELKGGVRLTRSKNGDCYYTTTPTECSCKARTFNPNTPCKHMKALQAGNSVEASRAQARAYQARQRELREQAKASSSPAEDAQPARRLARPPEDSILPTGGWIGPDGQRANGPVEA
jgi:hypothetical protein